MKTYEVLVFVPRVFDIQAKDDTEVLEKVGELYKELYKKAFLTWVTPLPEPEDCAWLLCRLVISVQLATKSRGATSEIGGERPMALFTIIRVYEVQADTQQQATDRMIEALTLHVERDYHVKDVIRAPGAKPGQGKKVELKPPAGWLSLLVRQLAGK